MIERTKNIHVSSINNGCCYNDKRHRRRRYNNNNNHMTLRTTTTTTTTTVTTTTSKIALSLLFLYLFLLPNNFVLGFSPSSPKSFLEGLIPTDGPIDDAHCNIEDLERANDSQLHTILTELKQTSFFKNFEVDLDHKCPLDTNNNSDHDDDDEEEEFECSGGDELGLEEEDEPLCTVSTDDDDPTTSSFFNPMGGGSSADSSSSPTLESNVLDNLSKGGFESQDHRRTFQWQQQTDMVIEDDDTDAPCDGESIEKYLPETFWMDMCSNIKKGDGTKLVNLQLNPERNTGYNGTHIWKAIYEENCLSQQKQEMCLEERVLYRLLSGLHTSTTLSIAKYYYPPSKRKGRTQWEANPIYFMDKFQSNPEYLRNLHFSYVVMLRALSKASSLLYNYEIHSGNVLEDETSTVLLKRLLDSAILQSCSGVFSAFDESLMFQESSIGGGNDVVSLQQNFKGVFHNISSILDCVQCQQCKLHGKMAMLGYGAALKILFSSNDLLISTTHTFLERNEIVALINTVAKLSESIHEVRELTTLYWLHNERSKSLSSSSSSSSQPTVTTTTIIDTDVSSSNTGSGSGSISSDTDLKSVGAKEVAKEITSFDLLDTAVGVIATLGRNNQISKEREEELIQLALSRHPELLILSKHYKNDLNRFLTLSNSIGELGGHNTNNAIDNIIKKPLPDAIIVGSGLAGLAAALNILDRGGTVIIIEKEHLLGGNSNKASSGINGCCPHNDTYGDSIELFRNDTIRSAGNVANLNLINTLVSNSEQAVTWLQQRVGVDLSLLAQLGGHSSKRTHRPNNGMAGAEIIYNIQKAVKSYIKSGKVTILVDTKVIKLLTDDDDDSGRVIGVEYETMTTTTATTTTTTTTKSDAGSNNNNNNNNKQELLADNVILATGGFAADRSSGSYLEQYRPELLKMPATAGNFSTGDGITLATTLGAGTRDMDKVQLHPTGWIDPKDPNNPSKILAAELMRGIGGILINKNGKRFCNELGTRAYVTDQMLSHNKKYAQTKKWDIKATIPEINLILSSSAADAGKKHIDLYTHKGLLTKLVGIKALADWIGVSKNTITSTIQTYQKASMKGIDEFGKTTFKGIPAINDDLDNEIFYAGKVTPVLHYCMGGIKIDNKGNVLKETDGSIIPGLHAAGEVTGGVHGNNRLGGNSLLECTVYGTIVGQKISIKEEKEKESQKIIDSSQQQQDNNNEEKSKELPKITLTELSKHNTKDDLWVAINGIVYDFTEFADEHPAGAESIYKLAGTDGTAAFFAVHNENMLEEFEEDKKGILLQIVDSSSSPSVVGEQEEQERMVTLEELKKHNTPEDCWVAFHGTVYNMTTFSQTHPGGSHLIQDIAGTDGTKQFGNVHKKKKLRLVKDDLIGQYITSD